MEKRRQPEMPRASTAANSHTSQQNDNTKLSLVFEPIDQIQLNPRDARIYSRAERRRFAKLFRKLGPIPIIATAELLSLSSSVYLEAAKEAGFSEIPVIILPGLTQVEADVFMIAQVRLVERGMWDEQKLGEILRDLTLQDLDFDLTLSGFDVAEIDMLILNAEGSAAADDRDHELPAPGPTVSRAGDVWIMRAHRLLNADALDPESYVRLMLGALADIVFTDAPYNVEIFGNVSGKGSVVHREFAMASGEMSETEFIAFLATVMKSLAAHSRPGSLHYLAMDWRHVFEVMSASRSAYSQFVNLCVWSKDRGGMGSLYRSQHELFFVFRNGDAQHLNNVQLGRFGRNRTNVWGYPGINTFGRNGEEGDLLALHPTVKPVALIVDVLLDASRRGDIVLDPFMGSGSTLIAAEKVGRCAYGIEIDAQYVDTAVRRWQRWTGEAAILEGDGRTFDEVAAARAKEACHDR